MTTKHLTKSGWPFWSRQKWTSGWILKTLRAIVRYAIAVKKRYTKRTACVFAREFLNRSHFKRLVLWLRAAMDRKPFYVSLILKFKQWRGHTSSWKRIGVLHLPRATYYVWRQKRALQLEKPTKTKLLTAAQYCKPHEIRVKRRIH